MTRDIRRGTIEREWAPYLYTDANMFYVRVFCVCAELQDWKLTPRSIWFPHPTPLSSPSPSIVTASWIISPPWSALPPLRRHLHMRWTPPSFKLWHTHVNLIDTYKKATRGNRKYITNPLSYHRNYSISSHCPQGLEEGFWHAHSVAGGGVKTWGGIEEGRVHLWTDQPRAIDCTFVSCFARTRPGRSTAPAPDSQHT